MDYVLHDTCRVCGSANLEPVFSMGDMYISNFVSDPKADHPRCPVDLDHCHNCSLVQLRATADPKLLYQSQYWYRSGTSPLMQQQLKDVVESVQHYVKLKTGDTVLDIGSNDGTMLQFYPEDVFKVGFEPAENIPNPFHRATLILRSFWDYQAYKECIGKPAKIITAIGMLYDLENPNRFIEDVSKALDPEGIFVAQLMTLQNMIDMHDVGNICHEHLEYYTIRSLRQILLKYGLDIFHIESNLTNGKSDRLYICKQGVRPYSAQAVQRLKQDGSSLINNRQYLKEYFGKWDQNRDRCREFIESVKYAGLDVWGYGASTKGNTILQYMKLDTSLITAIADANPDKEGLYTVGTGIPIVNKTVARAADPDYFVALPYAFINEFMDQEQEWMSKGGEFIVPFPKFYRASRKAASV